MIKCIKKDYYIIIGNNKENGLIVNSLENNKNIVPILLVDNEESYNLTIRSKYYSITCPENVNNLLKKIFKKIDKYKINIIINLNDNTKTIYYINEIKQLIKEYKLSTKTFNLYGFIDILDYQLLDEITRNSNGIINLINKNKFVSIDFVNEYPITKFMSEKHIDKDHASIDKDVSMNVIMLGFGSINQSIFQSYVSSTSFTSVINNKIIDNKVNYYLFDKNNLDNNHYLNEYYFKYEKDFLVNNKQSDYLQFPSKPCNLFLNNIDVYSFEFYKKLKNFLSSPGKVPYNYIIISLNEDLQNIAIGNNIINKLKEWDLLDYTKVFVYVKENSLYNHKNKNLYYFGNNINIYNYKNICNNFYKLGSIKRNLSYNIEYMLTNDKKVLELNTLKEKEEYIKSIENNIRDKVIKNFGEMNLITKESNIYSILSIRNKLNLLGFDYELASSDNISEASDYYKLYENNNLIDYLKDLYYNGKGIINYPCYVNKKVEINPRSILAYNEHNRWINYMISCGVVPSSINDIMYEVNENNKHTNGKNIVNFKHYGLTTIDGLSKYANVLATRDINESKNKGFIDKNKLINKYDVIKYDYQLMDDVEYFLNDINPLQNYLIVSKKYIQVCKYGKVINNEKSKKITLEKIESIPEKIKETVKKAKNKVKEKIIETGINKAIKIIEKNENNSKENVLAIDSKKTKETNNEIEVNVQKPKKEKNNTNKDKVEVKENKDNNLVVKVENKEANENNEIKEEKPKKKNYYPYWKKKKK